MKGLSILRHETLKENASFAYALEVTWVVTLCFMPRALRCNYTTQNNEMHKNVHVVGLWCIMSCHYFLVAFVRTLPQKTILINSLLHLTIKGKGKGKAVPLQTWSGPECFRKLRFPDFMTTAQDGGKVVSLIRRPPLAPENTPGTHFY